MKPVSLLSFLLLSLSVAHAAPVPSNVNRSCSPAIGNCQSLGRRQFDDFGGDFGGDSGDSGFDDSSFGGDSGFDDSSSGGGDTGFDDSTGVDTSDGFDDPSLDTTDPTADSSFSDPIADPSVDTADTDLPDDQSGLDDTTGDPTTDDPSTADDTTDDTSTDDPTATDSATADDATATDSATPDDASATDSATTDDASTTDSASADTATATESSAAAKATPPPAKAPPKATTPPPKAAVTPPKATPPPAKAATAPPAAAAGTCPPAINAATVNLIKQSEGFVPSPAPDPVNLPTVGFGHKCQKAGCSEVPFSFPLSQDTAAQLLQSDVKTFTKCINDFVSPNVQLNDNQFGALTSFTFNLGCGTLKSSTLLKRLNAGEDPNTVAEQEIPKFNKAGGKVLAGLTKRRTAEVALFKTASSTIAHPCQ